MNGTGIGESNLFKQETFLLMGISLLLVVGILFPVFLLLYLVLVCARLFPAGEFFRPRPGFARLTGRPIVCSGPRSPPL